jgi:hypothetical protein
VTAHGPSVHRTWHDSPLSRCGNGKGRDPRGRGQAAGKGHGEGPCWRTAGLPWCTPAPRRLLPRIATPVDSSAWVLRGALSPSVTGCMVRVTSPSRPRKVVATSGREPGMCWGRAGCALPLGRSTATAGRGGPAHPRGSPRRPGQPTARNAVAHLACAPIAADAPSYRTCQPHAGLGAVCAGRRAPVLARRAHPLAPGRPAAPAL